MSLAILRLIERKKWPLAEPLGLVFTQHMAEMADWVAGVSSKIEDAKKDMQAMFDTSPATKF